MSNNTLTPIERRIAASFADEKPVLPTLGCRCADCNFLRNLATGEFEAPSSDIAVPVTVARVSGTMFSGVVTFVSFLED